MDIPRHLVDAGAQALAEDDGEVWGSLPEYHHDMYRETARIVLEAAFLSCVVKEFIRIEFGEDGERRYTNGGIWSPQSVNYYLTNLIDRGDKGQLIVERKLIVECFFEPIAVRDEESL